MRLTRRVKIQLLIFAAASLIAGLVMSIGYIGLPSLLFGIGRYQVAMELPTTGGLYRTSNVTYRGQKVGRVVDVRMTDSGVEADLSLNSDVRIPRDLDAQVHSRSAIGEQYVELIPRPGAGSALLSGGDVIPRDRTSVPPDINTLLDQTNRGLQAIPPENLETALDEGAAALAGLGPDLARLVRGSTTLAIDAEANLPALTNLIDQAAPLLDTQSKTSDSIQAWAAHMAEISGQVRGQDPAVRTLLRDGATAAEEGRKLVERLRPSLPILLANLTGLADVALTYHAGVEQLLVLLPQAVAILDSALVPNLGNESAYAGVFVTFDLNLNVPPPCLTGYLPPSQQRSPAFEDYPERPEGNIYCRVPQDSQFNVRGARNLPCVNKPGKRAPTARMCDSDEHYEPLNDGYNWKGDPNATLSGQDVPEVPQGSAPVEQNANPAPPPIAVAEYDPATGTYVGPDGRSYTQSDLARDGGPTGWESMLIPPGR
ncbi:MCE family protein [Mycolicibacterium sp. OfavD-34-C]|uniref:MCE family protein n=1 Tax=Mycolicibacterium sp. OfavD-34-C TaxID=2917746 RepID=UPI001EF51046|nr:MlaD family protein [Mycolicibacterium sp. OfavD-34-C]MCG7578661.1 MCE family protein [Mycolicibacterium sp. OfavD-34-C]